MLTQEEHYKDDLAGYVHHAMEVLQQVQSQMEVVSSIQEIDKITQDIDSFEKGFSTYVQAKATGVENLAKYEVAANEVGQSIDKILASIEEYFNQHPSMFEEFERYRKAKEFKDEFNELQVLVWRFEKEHTPQIAQAIGSQLQHLVETNENLKAIMISPDTQQHLSETSTRLQSFLKLFATAKQANTNLELATQNMLNAAVDASSKMSALVEEELRIAHSKMQQAIYIIEALLIVALIVAIAMGIWLVRSIMLPLQESIDFAKRISEGDLSQAIHIRNEDEFALLNSALNQSANSLRTIVEKLMNLTQTTEQGSRKIIESVSLSSESIEQQQLETSQVATAINQMSASTHEISQNASTASEQSSQAETQAQSGLEQVQKTIQAIAALSQEMESASNVVEKLDQDTGNIVDILSVIRGIADQTNLLALNAAIEAARAGEQGRGFSVVADEVRSLAQKTQDSISEISQIIDAIQQGASNVVQVMGQSQTSTQNVMVLMNQSGETYDLIVAAINEVTNMNMQVSVATEQQASVAEEINRNISKINSLVSENAASLRLIEGETHEQGKNSQALSEVVGFFKIS